MPRQVDPTIQEEVRQMMLAGVGQREITRQLGVSRPWIRNFAKEIGYQFPRNGKEVLGELCQCEFCEELFRRPTSKMDRSEKHYCSTYCKGQAMRGDKHHNWKDGSTYHQWWNQIANKQEYKDWREIVLKRDGYKCSKCGSSTDLHVHHIMPKSQFHELSLDVDNGITLCQKCHMKMHSKEGLH